MLPPPILVAEITDPSPAAAAAAEITDPPAPTAAASVATRLLSCPGALVNLWKMNGGGVGWGGIGGTGFKMR